MGDWFGGGLVRVEMARDLSSSAQIASAGVGAGAVVSAVGLESLNAWVQVEPSPANCLPHHADCLPHHADCLPHQADCLPHQADCPLCRWSRPQPRRSCCELPGTAVSCPPLDCMLHQPDRASACVCGHLIVFVCVCMQLIASDCI